MNHKSSRLTRMHVLAFATALACGTPLVYAAPATPQPPRVLTGGLQSGVNFDRFIVKYRAGTLEAKDAAMRQIELSAALERARPEIERSQVRSANAAKSSGAMSLQQVRRMTKGADVVRLSQKIDRQAAQALMREIAANPSVEYVEVDRLNKALFVPNDPGYAQQWGFNGATAGIRAETAWNTTSGAGAVVAVLDTGITNHADLNANILPGYDFIVDTFVSRDGNGRDADPSDPGDWITANECGGTHAAQNSSWHGTHVAGTVAAVTNNSTGVAGTAYSAKVVPVRVLGRCGGYDSDIADAIIWASGGTVSGVPANANPAEVINLSLGGSGACGATTQAAINTAVANGSTLVIAAGNDNVNVSNASPANCSNVVAVASITSTGARSSFSNYGALIDIAAPGSNIYSTLNAGTTTPGAASYASYNGTSMATPHVAGVVALIQSVSATPKTPAQVETLLKSSARAFPATPSQTIGSGMLDAAAAVAAAQGGGADTTAPSTPSGLSAAASGSSQVNLSWSAASDTGGSGLAGYRIERCSGAGCSNFAEIATTASTSFANTGLAASTSYSYRIRAYDGAGNNSGYSASASATTAAASGNVLQNGVTVSGLGAATGASLNYTMVVPAGATNLSFVTSGGTGDSDMYVKFGSAPTDTVYDCRPYQSGNAETCSFAAPQAGTYHVRLKAYSTFSGVSLRGSFTAGGGGGGAQTYSNTTDYTVGDNTTVDSPITVSGRSGNASSTSSVTVDIIHTYQGDLKVDLVAPDGTLYNIHNRTGAGTDNFKKTVTLNLSSEVLNGTWRLRVNDNAAGDTGYINSWSITF